MKSFVEFNEEQKGTYVELKLSKKSAKQLAAYVKKNNIENPTKQEEYHCTVVYSTKSIAKAKDEKVDLPFTTTFDKWELFPTKEGTKCLVARLKKSSINDLHDMYHTKYDAKYDFDEYKPHVTVSYNFDNTIPLEKPEFDFTFDKMTFKELDTNWKPS